MKMEDIQQLVEQSQTEFINRLVKVGLIDDLDDVEKGVVVIFLRSYTQEICDIIEVLIDEMAEEVKNER